MNQLASSRTPAVLEAGHCLQKRPRLKLRSCVRASGDDNGAAADGASTPSRKLQSSLLERSMPDRKIMDQAETEIAGYCLTLPGSEEAERCWIAHQHYADKLRSSESGCEIEFTDGNISGEDCAQLERLEAFARTMMSSGKIGNFVRSLYAMHTYAKRQEAEKVEAAGQDAPEEGPLMTKSEADDFETRQAELRAIFKSMDRDGNGRLDVGEFRDAMKGLGNELSGQDCAHLLEAMDIYGSISEEDFLAIVEAKGMWEKDTAITKVLRRLSLRPSWFQDMTIPG